MIRNKVYIFLIIYVYDSTVQRKNGSTPKHKLLLWIFLEIEIEIFLKQQKM